MQQAEASVVSQKSLTSQGYGAWGPGSQGLGAQGLGPGEGLGASFFVVLKSGRQAKGWETAETAAAKWMPAGKRARDTPPTPPPPLLKPSTRPPRSADVEALLG